MSLRRIVKSAAFVVLGSPLVTAARLRRLAASDAVTVLSLHRVGPMDGSTYPPLDPQLFRELLQFCQRNFSLTTFGELGEQQGSKPPMILSFDDGYKDFIEYSAPILEEFGIACNQNLIPRAIESGEAPFNVVLNDFAGKASERDLLRFTVPGFRPFTAAEGRYVWGNALSTWFKERPFAAQVELAEVIRPQIDGCDGFVSTPMMSLDEARQIAAVHEIGAHSFDHANLGQESNDYVAADARRCRDWFREKMDLDVGIYALPNGDYREEQVGIIEQAGYSTVLLVGQRFSQRNTNRHFRFNFDAVGLAEMRFKACGGMVRP